MGDSGLAANGLDLVLEAFAEMPEYSLTVCGPVDKEPDFRDAFHKELFETPNITTICTTNDNTQQVSDLAPVCAGMVYPSASDGQSDNIIMCMSAGLIPIVSSQSGVDVDDFGFVIDECSTTCIRDAVREISGLPAESLARMSRNAWSHACARHGRDVFSRDYRRIAASLLARKAGK